MFDIEHEEQHLEESTDNWSLKSAKKAAERYNKDQYEQHERERAAAPQDLVSLANRLFSLLQGAAYVPIDAATMCALHRIATGSPEDVVIFSNGGGQSFHCWTGKVARDLVRLEKFHQTPLYAWRIDGKEEVPYFPRQTPQYGVSFYSRERL